MRIIDTLLKLLYTLHKIQALQHRSFDDPWFSPFSFFISRSDILTEASQDRMQISVSPREEFRPGDPCCLVIA